MHWVQLPEARIDKTSESIVLLSRALVHYAAKTVVKQ